MTIKLHHHRFKVRVVSFVFGEFFRIIGPEEAEK